MDCSRYVVQMRWAEGWEQGFGVRIEYTVSGGPSEVHTGPVQVNDRALEMAESVRIIICV